MFLCKVKFPLHRFNFILCFFFKKKKKQKAVAVSALSGRVLFQNVFYNLLLGNQLKNLKVPDGCLLFVLLLPVSLNKNNWKNSSDFDKTES